MRHDRCHKRRRTGPASGHKLAVNHDLCVELRSVAVHPFTVEVSPSSQLRTSVVAVVESDHGRKRTYSSMS